MFIDLRMPVGARFSAPVQTNRGAHRASFTMGTGSFPAVKSGRGVTLTPHPLLAPWSRKSRAISLFLLWAVRPVQRFSACTRVHFTTLPLLTLGYMFRFSRNHHQALSKKKRVALIMLIIALQFDVSTSKKKKRVALIMLIIALMN